MKTKDLKKEILILLISFCLVAILAAVWDLLAPFQIDNDNIYLKTIISGEMTGKSESHMLHISVISGFLLSIFYTVFGNGIPWFGLFLCLSMALPMTAMLYFSLRKCSKIYQYVTVGLFFVLIYCTFFYRYFAKTQYTLATGMAGAGALLLFFFISFDKSFKETLLQSIPFWIAAVWSFAIRDKAFIMLFPFLGLIILRKLITSKDKKTIGNISFTVLVFAVIIALAALVNKAAYSNDEWKEYREYNSLREAMIDYNGLPDYDANKDLYDECGITRSSYEAFLYHYNIILDENINRDTMEKLAYASRNADPDRNKGIFERAADTVKTAVKRSVLEYEDRPLNILVFALFFFAALMLVIKRKYKGLFDVLIVSAAGAFDMFYLVFNGRYPFRVTQIVFIAELVLLFAIIVENELWMLERKKDKSDSSEDDPENVRKIFNPAFAVFIIAILAVSLRFGLPVTIKEFKQAKATDEYSICFEELEDYLESHKENFYLFDMSHLYYCEDTLAFGKEPFENYVYMGSWMVNSPWYKRKLEENGIKNVAADLIEKDNFYIVYQQVDFDTRDFLDYYFDEHFPGAQLNPVDSFTSSNGFVYEILKVTR